MESLIALNGSVDALRTTSTAAVDVVTKTFVCSDVVGSTAMMERLGDAVMFDVMERHDRIVLSLVHAHGGHELELRGDGFYLGFDEPVAAVRCAAEIQRSLELDRSQNPGLGVEVRMSAHRGKVLSDGRRYFGRDLVFAFRLLDVAAGGELVVSDSVARVTSGHFADRFDEPRFVTLKSFRDRFRVRTFRWSDRAALPTFNGGVAVLRTDMRSEPRQTVL